MRLLAAAVLALLVAWSVAFAQMYSSGGGGGGGGASAAANPNVSLSSTSLITCIQTNGYVPCVNQNNANLIINPSMDIDQAHAGTAVTLASGTAAYGVDGFKGQFVTGTGVVVTLQQCPAAPCSSGTAPAGFANFQRVKVTTSSATTAAGDYLKLYQPIEANYITNLNFGTANAALMCLSWYSESSVANLYASVSIQNAAATESYVAPFSESGTANTWQQHQICFSGDQGGTWVTSGTAEGLRINFVLECGSTFSSTDGNPRLWKSSPANALCANNAAPTQLTKTTNATFDLTGVKLEFVPNGWPLASTPFTRNPVGLDLVNAQRYYSKTFQVSTAPAQSGGLVGALCALTQVVTAGSWSAIWNFPASMRAAPTIVTYNPSAANANIRDITGASDVVVAVDPGVAKSPDHVEIGSQTTALTANHRLCIQASADARL